MKYLNGDAHNQCETSIYPRRVGTAHQTAGWDNQYLLKLFQG
jgi:hypothetical protein